MSERIELNVMLSVSRVLSSLSFSGEFNGSEDCGVVLIGEVIELSLVKKRRDNRSGLLGGVFCGLLAEDFVVGLMEIYERSDERLMGNFEDFRTVDWFWIEREETLKPQVVQNSIESIVCPEWF
jgi:hypothetical protein